MKLAEPPHSEMKITVSDNMITLCEGCVDTVQHGGVVFDDWNKNFESLLS
jgi:hypothetical protein